MIGYRARCFSCARESLGFTTSCHLFNRSILLCIHSIIYLGTLLPFLLDCADAHHHWQNPDAILADLASMLLSNLTSSSSACAALLSLQIQVVPLISTTSPISYHPVQSRSGTCSVPVPYPSIDPQQVHALPLLVEAFVQGASLDPNPNSERIRKGDLHFLSSVFANISAVSNYGVFISCAATVSYSAFILAVTYRQALLYDSKAWRCDEAWECTRIFTFQDRAIH